MKIKTSRSSAVDATLRRFNYLTLRVLFALLDYENATASKIAGKLIEQSISNIRGRLATLHAAGLVVYREEKGEHPSLLERVYSLTPTTKLWLEASLELAKEIKE